MATLLRMKGSQEAHDQLERLQNMLQQKNSEIEELIMQVKQLEKSKVCVLTINACSCLA